ncbi:hypothetical protein Pfo_029447 [Paulownia fortunei]|nr:hypothetical protein Pfo_029447 [Paulownia fortunei]
MKADSLANPNFSSMAALLHSTPLLSLKKRTYWPERSDRWGPPRPRYELVYERSQVSDIEKLNDDYPTYWYWGAEDGRTQDSCKQSGNSSSKSFNIPLPDMTSERLTLGLSATGPLNLEDVRIAYRSCAVKWHPDHHQGCSKAFAEEKFKICCSAYQSLRNKLSSS